MKNSSIWLEKIEWKQLGQVGYGFVPNGIRIETSIEYQGKTFVCLSDFLWDDDENHNWDVVGWRIIDSDQTSYYCWDGQLLENYPIEYEKIYELIFEKILIENKPK